MNGIIVKNISDLYTVKYENLKIDCKAKGIFRNIKITPTVGDNVIFDENKKIITKVLDRKNILERPPVSNVDVALIVMSVTEPDFNTNLLDKLLIVISFNKITPIICLSKLDLLDNYNLINKYIKYYENLGYKVIKNTDYDSLKEIFKDKITVITGQSGVGKSTLLNHIDNSLSLKTNEISKALGRGKHTTRHTELIDIENGLVADTPGFSSITFEGMVKEDIKKYMVEFNRYSDKCKYNDCTHIKEEDCYIKHLIEEGIILESRYINYKKFIIEIENQQKY